MDRVGRYELQGELGRGGFGVVYRAFDPVMRRQVAIKVLTALSEPTSIARFRSEAGTTGSLLHQNIVTVFDFGEHEGLPYLVMELLEGQSLLEVMREEPALSLIEKVDILMQIAGGLSCAHEHGVVHRDVKPANVMVLRKGTVKILDFGIARFLNQANTRHTIQGYIVGTIEYMAPEQLQGADADVVSDLFSFGVLCYELLSGIQPFRANNLSRVVYLLTTFHPEPLVKLVADCPDELSRIVLTSIHKDRSCRYQSLQDLLLDLNPVHASLRRKRSLELIRQVRDLVDAQNLESAQALLRKLLDLDPANEEGHDLRREIQHRRGRQRQVESLLAAAREFAAAGDFEKALRRAEAAILVDPANGEAHSLQARYGAELRRLEEEQRRQQLEASVQRVAARVQQYLQTDRFNEASALVVAALARFGNDPTLRSLQTVVEEAARTHDERLRREREQEEERRLAADAARREEEQRAAVEALRLEEQRREERRLAADAARREEEQRAAAEALRLEEQRREERRLAADAARREEEQRAAAEALRLEEQRREEQRLAAAAARREEEQRAAAEALRLEEQRREEQRRLAADAARREEEQRAAAEALRLEERRREEQRLAADAARREEEQRAAAEALRLEEQRREERRLAADAARREEQQRAAAEALRLEEQRREEQRRLAADAERREQEQRRGEDQRRAGIQALDRKPPAPPRSPDPGISSEEARRLPAFLSATLAGIRRHPFLLIAASVVCASAIVVPVMVRRAKPSETAFVAGVAPPKTSNKDQMPVKKGATPEQNSLTPDSERRTASPAIASFSVEPPELRAGQSATLSWRTSGDVQVSIDAGIGSVDRSGSRLITPQKTSTYTLTAEGRGGSARSSVTVRVASIPLAPRVEGFTVEPNSIHQGQSSTLRWSISGETTRVSIDQGIGNVPPTGNRPVSPAGTTEYVLTATGPGGSTSSSVTVGVAPSAAVPAPPAIEWFSAEPAAIQAGETATLQWNVRGEGLRVSINPSVGSVRERGTSRVTPPQTAVYELTAIGPGGTATRKVTVDVKTASPAPSVDAQENDRKAILQTIADYSSAVENKNEQAIRSVWPTIPPAVMDSWKTDFRDARAITLEFQATGPIAPVKGFVRVECATKLHKDYAGSQPYTSEIVTRFALRLQGGRWVIESAR